MMFKSARGFLTSVSALSMIAVTAPAFAQATQDVQLETVTVSGVRGFGSDVTQVGGFRGAKLVDTPMTINVLPRDLLDAQQAANLNDTLRNVAGVNNSQVSTVVMSGQSVRGIALDNRNAYRMDGSLPIINLIDLPTEDKERVELMKGASALYYGFASPAGVVNLTMKRPTQDPMLDMRVFGNMYGAVGAAIDFGNTVGDGKFGYRINGVYTGVNPGIQNTTGTRSLISAAVDYHPIDDVVMQVDLEHIFKSMPEPGIFRFVSVPTPTLGAPYPSIALPDIHGLDPKINTAPNWAQFRAEETNVLSHNVWNINSSWAFTLDAGASKLDRRRIFTTLQPINTSTGTATEQFQYSIQQSENRNYRIQLDGKLSTWILVHNLTVGTSDNVRDTFSVSAAQTACAGGVYSITCQSGITSVGAVTVNYLNPAFTAKFGPRQATPVYTGNVTRIDDMGYYFYDRIEATEYAEIIGGVRLGNYHENIVKPTPSQTFHAAPTSTAVSLVVKPLGDDQLSVYASYIEALETTAPAPTTASNFPFQPAPTPSFEREVGIKYEPWKGLLAQVSIFNINRGNAVIDGANNYGLNGRSRFQGAEFSLNGSLTDDLSIAASAMVLQAKVISGTPTCGPGTAVGTLNGCKVFTPTLVGRDVDNTAKVYGSLFAQYKLDGLSDSLEGLAINAGLYYVGARYINPLNEARAGDYTLLDLGASYSTDAFQYPMTFRLNARNVGNRRYWAATSANLLAAGQPADVQFSLEAHL